MSGVILSLDLGTTVAKTVVFDLSGSELHVAERAIGVSTPGPGRVEQNAEEIWERTVEVLRASARFCEETGAVPAALAVATQGGSVLPLNGEGGAAGPCVTWMDRRSMAVVEGWKRDGTAERIRSISGWSPEPGLPLPVIVSLRKEEPELFAEAARWVSMNDFLHLRLTGRAATDPSMAGEMLLCDLQTGGYSEELCALAGIDAGQLSPIIPSSALSGSLGKEAAEAAGLPGGLPVVNGGQDHSCEALACGLLSSGKTMLACGTAWVINGVTGSPNIGAVPAEMNLNPHVVPGSWIVSRFLGPFGGGFEQWLGMCRPPFGPEGAMDRKEVFALLERELAGTGAGSGGLFHVPFGGSSLAAGCEGMGGFIGIEQGRSSADMGRAIMESAAYEVLASLERLGEGGMKMEEIWMVGGAAGSSLWPQIIADVTGVSVSIPRYAHGPSIGAAILAGTALGFWENCESGRERFSLEEKTIAPRAETREAYTKGYGTYTRLMHTLADFNAYGGDNG